MPRVTRPAVPPRDLDPDDVRAYQEWKRQNDRAEHAAPAAPFRTVRAADEKPERIRWVWPGRFPRGKLVTLDGDPGTGKSTLCLDWAARVTRGGRWPDGAPARKGDVLLLSAEDGLSDTILPRLIAAGADLERVHVVKGQISLPAHLGYLEDEIRARRAMLVIVDVLMAYLGDETDSYRDQAMRRALSRIADVADRTGACIIAIRHLNKATGMRAVYRGGGSIGIIGQARAAFLVAGVPGDERKRVLAPIKVNIATMPASLSYRIVSDEKNGCGRIEWDGICGQTADDLLTDPDDGRKGYLYDAADWLDDYMRECDGEAKSGDVIRAGQAAGYSKDILYKARAVVGVRSERERSFRGNPRWVSDSHRASQCREDGSTE